CQQDAERDPDQAADSIAENELDGGDPQIAVKRRIDKLDDNLPSDQRGAAEIEGVENRTGRDLPQADEERGKRDAAKDDPHVLPVERPRSRRSRARGEINAFLRQSA